MTKIGLDFSSLRFGEISENPAATALLGEMNRALFDMLRDLPGPLQGVAVILLQTNYAGFSLSGGVTNFFGNLYYPPAYTILHHLESRGLPLPVEIRRAAVRTQAAAMFLHMFDDHLVDGQIPPDHLAIQLRTQVYLGFREGIGVLAGTDHSGQAARMAEMLIDSYFAAVHRPVVAGDTKQAETREPRDRLQNYCDRFRDEMATWLVAPLLIAARCARDAADRESLVDGVRRAYESFGIAWRLLDDLRDWPEDFRAGQVSAVSQSLSDRGRDLWHAPEKNETKLIELLQGESVFPRLFERIQTELDAAAKMAAAVELSAAAREYRSLAAPLAPFEKATSAPRIG